VKEADALIKLRDAFGMAAEALNELLETMAPFVDMSKIKWEKAHGPQGEYEKSTDVQNPEYQKLLDDLIQHNGKLALEGFFVWQFSDGKAIGKKRK
jgi:hypothetical protein